jgi:hypothetical protein
MTMIFFIFAISAKAEELKISHVIVLDSSFQQIRVIDQPDQIKQLKLKIYRIPIGRTN